MNIFTSKNQLPMIIQSETAECGLACLTMVANYLGVSCSLAQVREGYAASLLGLSLRDLLIVSQKLGLKGKARSLSLEQLKLVTTPLLLHWDLQHFVVLKKVVGDKYIIHDPAIGIRKINLAEVSHFYTGISVSFKRDKKATVTLPKAVKPINLLNLLPPIADHVHPLLQILLLSLILESFILLQPVIINLFIEQVLPEQSIRLLFLLTGAVIFIALSIAITSMIRDYTVIKTGAFLNFSVAKKLLKTTLQLPLSFFEKRQLGHLLERYQVTENIQYYLTSSIPLALIDGVVALFALIGIAWFNWIIALINLGTVGLFLLIRYSTLHELRYREIDVLQARGIANGDVIETINGISSVKLNALEPIRFHRWQYYFSRLIHSQQQLTQRQAFIRGLMLGVLTLNLAGFIWVAGQAILLSTMTMGVLLGILFYNVHFLQRTYLLVERLFELYLLNIKIARLDDLFVAEPEQQSKDNKHPKLQGNIELKNICFQYPHSTQPLLKHINLKINQGEFIAIKGINGVGKTTLLRILMGIIQPTTGDIYFDEHHIRHIDHQYLRQQLGCIIQADQLFTGSITENITFFDLHPNLERAVSVAKLVGIHEHLDALPMGYNTFIGDLGSPFSQGQTQKILLARTLYRQPKILLFDEGTAYLDADSEQHLLQQLKKLGLTIICVAHRPAAFTYADRIIEITQSHIQELPLEDIHYGS